MATYTLPDAGIPNCITYTTKVIAGLKAAAQQTGTAGLTGLAAPWEAERKALRAERDEVEALADTLIERRAVVDVADVVWDGRVLDLSGEAFLAAGKKATAEPYASLFGTTTAKEAMSLGPDKATRFGTKAVARSKALGVERLAAPTNALDEANGALEAAHKDRTAAEIAVDTVGRREGERRTRIEALISTTEVEILKLLPGRRDLVRTVLSPWKSAKKKRTAPTPPAPAGTPA